MKKKYKKANINIDSLKGGNGDIWMRLVSFYAIAALMPENRFSILIPQFFRKIAQHTFGDRLIFPEETGTDSFIHYTSLGIKDLLKPILKGEKFIAPYQRAVIHDKKQRSIKDNINIAIFKILDLFGYVQVPSSKWITYYQGYLDVIGLKKLRNVSYQTFTRQLEKDYPEIVLKLNDNIPVSTEINIPPDLMSNILIFPTGTSRQFMPVLWAKQYFRDAYYAFFYKDGEAQQFIDEGLKVIYFFKEPGDIIELANNAKWTISTDSFPSHLLQYATSKCTITITEVLASRIITPVYAGKVVDAVAPCHPCLHLARKIQPLCEAGYVECINWYSEKYLGNIQTSVNI